MSGTKKVCLVVSKNSGLRRFLTETASEKGDRLLTTFCTKKKSKQLLKKYSDITDSKEVKSISFKNAQKSDIFLVK